LNITRSFFVTHIELNLNFYEIMDSPFYFIKNDAQQSYL